MRQLNEALKNDFGAELSNTFVRKACYYPKIDCIEYMSEDRIAISDRIDGFLTLLWDEDLSEIVGFKLKGFRYAFDKYLKPLKGIMGDDFNLLMVTALERYFTDLGNELIPEKREEAYKNVISFIRNKDISIDDSDLREIDLAA